MLISIPNDTLKFLEIYFIRHEKLEIDQDCSQIQCPQREIVQQLQRLFYNHYQLINMFYIYLERMVADKYNTISQPCKRTINEQYLAVSQSYQSLNIGECEFEQKNLYQWFEQKNLYQWWRCETP